MLEDIVLYLQTSDIPVYLILLFGFLTAFTENVIPPIPGDGILIFLGAFIGLGKVDFIPLLIVSTIGSSLGFSATYYIGKKLGLSIVQHKSFTFISTNSIEKVSSWFQKYGWWMIVLNRFLAGTRAIISFFAGITNLNFKKSIILSTISSLAWNILLLYLGLQFGQNWEKANKFINDYSLFVSIFLSLIALFFIIRFFYNKRKNA
jgi:membrane protein DedA with SNARE-associated domain